MWPFSKSNPKSETASITEDGPNPLHIASAIVRALPDPAMVLGSDLTVIISNEALKVALEADPVGHPISRTVRAPAVLDAVNAVIAGEAGHHVDFEVRFPVPRTFHAYVAPIGAREGVLIVLRDLTREQQIERMRADFVANASHELRTPLASLSGFIETIQGAARNDEKAQMKFLGLMRSQADRMKRLIDDLLSLSRIEMNEHVRPSDPVDMAQVANHVRDALSGLARDYDCELKVRCETGLVVLGSRDDLVQVVQNLVENALKYASSGRLIEIEGRKNGTYAEIAVKDHGRGIAEQHLPRLTERFYRVNVQESRSRGGTGLGLAIVKHILNRHRGRLIIASELGKGSTFTIRLPLK